MTAGDMVIRRKGEAVVVTQADDVILVADELLLSLDDEWSTYDGEVFTVTASNGTWRYRREGLDAASRAHIFVREDAS